MSDTPPNTPPTPETVTLSKADHEALLAKLASFEKPTPPPAPKPEPDLLTKTKEEQEKKAKSDGDAKALEAAIRFNLNAEKWLNDNKSVLPKDVAEIFAQAEKETFDTPIEKDKAIKAGLIQSFFSVQSHLDLLTPAIKNQLEDYLKLTKNGKQDKAQSIYDTIFEPAFEMLKRVKRAEALQKGHGDGTEDGYRDRLISGSRKHYLGENKNA